VADSTRFAKTEKGADEISNRRNNLRGKMRTMLILIDARKTADELRDQAGKLGVPPDFLETMVHDGYIAPVGGAPASPAAGTVQPAVASGATSATATPAAPAGAAAALPTGAGPVPASAEAGAPAGTIAEPVAADAGAISNDEFARFRDAKTFMNETVVNALGIRAFLFTLRLERCSTRADLVALFPDYEKAIRKASGETDAQVLASHLRDMLG
jgi:hypothetical protein